MRCSRSPIQCVRREREAPSMRQSSCNSPPYIAKCKNPWSCTSTLPYYGIMSWQLFMRKATLCLRYNVIISTCLFVCVCCNQFCTTDEFAWKSCRILCKINKALLCTTIVPSCYWLDKRENGRQHRRFVCSIYFCNMFRQQRVIFSLKYFRNT